MTEPAKYAAAKKTFIDKRAALAEQLTDLALAEGLGGLAVLSAARRLGTSDRMLFHYFDSKAGLVCAVFDCVARRQSELLAQRRNGPPAPPHELLSRAWSIVGDPRFVPFMRIWAEVSSRGSRGEAPYDELASAATKRWLDWIETRLALPEGRKRRTHAAAILTLLEGATLMEMSRPGATRGVVAVLSEALRDGVSASSKQSTK